MSENQQKRLDEFDEWKSHPITERFFNYLRLVEASAKEDWAREQFVGTSMEEMALRNAKALGGVSVLRQMTQVDMEAIIEAEKEAREQIRN